MKRLLITLFLLLFWAALPAQQAPVPAENPTQQETPSEQDAVEQDPAMSDEEDIQVDEDSSANPPPPSSRFEPTEQISEDLSVSFPIDI